MPSGVRLLLFAGAREAVGSSRLVRPVPKGGVALDRFLGDLAIEFPRLEGLLPSSRFALNGEYVARGTARLAAGDELAVHPPYSGG